MLEKILKGLFSMGAMTLGLIAFLSSIAVATFIESDYGTPASKIAVFNAAWFEVLLVYLGFALIANIFRYKMYRPEKVAMFAFHISFIVILIGAGVTRYFSFEGQMPIKEKEASNILYSSDPHVTIKVDDGINGLQFGPEKRYLSEYYDNGFGNTVFNLPNKKPVIISYVSYLENRVDSVYTADSIASNMLEFVVRGQKIMLAEGDAKLIGSEIVSYNMDNAPQGIKIYSEGSILKIQSIKEFSRVDMSKLTVEDRQRNFLDSNAVTTIPADTSVQFYSGQLYNFESESVMFKELRKHTAVFRIKSKQKDAGVNFLRIKVEHEGNTKFVDLPYENGTEMHTIPFQFEGFNMSAGYGPTPIQLPFSVRCDDFVLDKYPGSEMPSSFASNVTVLDTANNKTHSQRIFMNNVMDYGGYRFFQSSYYPDETGTVLSVNHDWWGTNITYLGYLLMSIGMVLSLFSKTGRFRDLINLINKSQAKRAVKALAIVLGFTLFSSTSYANSQDHFEGDGHNHSEHEGHNHEQKGLEETTAGSRTSTKVALPADFKFNYISEAHSDSLASLLVQDYSGRFIPFHTMATDFLRKLSRKDTYEGKNAVQVIMGMHLAGPYWTSKPVIAVSSKIRDEIGLNKYASLNDISDERGLFIWAKEYDVAHEKPDSRKSVFDKEILKLGERYQLLRDIFEFRKLRIIPIQGDVSNTWLWPFLGGAADADKPAMNLAAEYLHKAWLSGDSKQAEAEANELLSALKKYQRKVTTSKDLPSIKRVNAEVTYNKMNFVKGSSYYYLILGFLMLVIFFVRVLISPTHKTEKIFKYVLTPFVVLFVLVFIYHGIGLGFRWYVSGHAPWSNGYEAVVFIAWVTVLAGFIFSRKNGAVLPATGILAFCILFVTQMSLLDPQISPLQPVLKSYWLKIHVAIITGSYGFLGLGAILGLLNMVLFTCRTKLNGKRLTMNINEITAVSEMTITIGLFMLTIGTFLGGVWANESWGRYWGWDPKETWALVSVLTYAVILHLRYIPGLKDKFIFNLVSFWGYSSILFTFFGVNFKLTGLHSYAQGEGVTETPMWVIYTIVVFAIVSAICGAVYLINKQKKIA